MKTTAYSWDQLLRTVRAAVEPRYIVLELIGVGGMASVYLAQRRSDELDVALKVMHPGLRTKAADIARFEREAAIVSRLDHEHVVRVQSVRDCAGLLCLELQYMPGGSLVPIVADHREGLPIPIVLHWLAQIGSAVGHAHDAGVLHRDLNTSNVLLDADGNAFVADFGIALVAEEPRLTDLGMMLGTPAYMSPEQLADQPATAASDQYSLGIAAYELIAGRRPFYGAAAVVVDAHVTQVPSPVTKWRPDCAPRTAKAIARMLEKKPDRRFGSVQEAMNSLGARLLPRTSPYYEQLRQLIPGTHPPA